MRVCFQHSDEHFLYVTPLDSIADEPLRVRYNIPQFNEEFAETCKLLWQHAQLNLLDINVDDNGILNPAFIVLEPDYLIDISSLAASIIIRKYSQPLSGRMDPRKRRSRLPFVYAKGLPPLPH